MINFLKIIEDYQEFIIPFLITIVLIFGLMYSITLGDSIRFPDESEYLSIANNLVSKGIYSIDGLNPTAYRLPGYPLILSIFVLFKSNLVILRFLNFLFFAGSLLLVYLILKKLLSGVVGVLAAFLLILYPVLFYTAGTFYPQTLGSLLLLAFIYFIFCTERNKIKNAIAAGLVVGYLIITISTFVFILIVTVIFLFIFNKEYKRPAIIILISFLVIFPWIIRNYFVFDKSIILTTNFGYNLLLGNSPNTTPNSGVNVDISIYRKQISSSNEVERDNFYKDIALNYISENKMKILFLYFMKFLNYFNFRNELAIKKESSNFKDIIMFITYYPLIVLLIIRILIKDKYPLLPVEKYTIIIYFLNGMFQAIFFTRIRFRIPFDVILILIVAIALFYLLNNLNYKNRQNR